ncbi:MAG: hypothetical protein V2B18_07650 [Pseudomonadota bacterium]
MKKLPIVVLWAIAFAYVESAVVEYLRAIYHPLEQGGFRFPLPAVSQFEAMGAEHVKRLIIELGREISTLVMLAAVAVAVGRNFREATAHFMIAFGVWDIFFYLWLKLFLDWPDGLMTWDLLFLVPVPWVGPVLAPVIVSVIMIVVGIVVLHYESRGIALRSTWYDWGMIVCGGVTAITSFCLDADNIMNGGFPNPFNWTLFLAGLFLASTAFVIALRRNLSAQPH